MRIVKWFFIVLFVLILIPVGGLSAIISGLWSINLKLDNDSIILDKIAENTGYNIELSQPVHVKISKEFSILGENIRIKSANNTTDLLTVAFLDIYGQINFDILFGNLPKITVINGNEIILNLQQDSHGTLILPKVAELLPQTQDHSSIITAFAQEVSDFDINQLPLEKISLENMQINLTRANQTMHLNIALINAVKPQGSSDGFIRMNGLLNETPITMDIGITGQGVTSGIVDFAGVNVQLDGQALQDMDINSFIKISDTTSLSQFLGQPLPSGPFEAEINIAQKSGVYHIGLTRFQANNSLFSGNAILSIRGRALSGGIKGNKIDLTDFTPQTKEDEIQIQTASAQEDTSEEDQTKIISNIQLPAILLSKPLLPDFSDMEINLDIGMVHAKPFVLEDVKLKLTADHLGAEIDINHAKLGLGGEISGLASIKVGENPQIISDIQLLTTPISTFQSFAPVISKMDGDINAIIKGAGSGADLRSILASYSGDFQISLYNGYLHLPDEAGKILNTIAPSVLEEGLLILQCADIQSTFKNGLDSNLDMAVMSHSLISYGGGEVNLATETTNMKLLNELTVLGNNMALPLQISGHFKEPQFDSDINALVTGKVSNKLPPPDRSLSPCHDQVSSNLSSSFSASRLNLQGISNLSELSNLNLDTESIKNTIQEKLLDKVKSNSVSNKNQQKIQEVIDTNLDPDQIDKIEEIGKNLLGGLLGG